MKTKTYIIAWALAALCLFAISMPVLTAAEPANETTLNYVESEQPVPGHVGIVEMLSPVVAFVVTFLVKRTDKIPGFLLVAIPGIAAGLFAYLGGILGATDIPIWQGVLLGLIANVVHQFGVQVNQSIERNTPTYPGIR